MASHLASCSYSTLPFSRIQRQNSINCYLGSTGRCLQRRPCSRASRRRPGHVQVQASLDQSAFLSVFQQGVAFVIVNLGEGIYTRSQLKASKGRPSIGILLLSNVALVGGLYLLAMGQTKAGLAVGTTTSAALLLLDIKRAYDVEDDPKEWPGPKAWPATLALISFFAVNVFGQALLRV